MGAPWKVFFKDDKKIVIDVDGNIDVDGHVARPFPCSITNAEICSSGLIATWVDHDLRLARMAMLDIDESIKDGITKSDLRLMRNTSDVTGSKWSHAIDAEPLCMAVGENKIFFALWSRGIYCIDFEATEKWRIPLFENPDKSPPRAKEITAISVLDEYAIVWSRDGTFRKINSESGDVEFEGSIEAECDLESVFNYGEKFLLSSKDGWVWEYENQQITVARKLRGTVQDAIFDGEDWRIICWRDDVMLRGGSSRRAELGVQIVMNEGSWSVMDNQGQISPHMKE